MTEHTKDYSDFRHSDPKPCLFSLSPHSRRWRLYHLHAKSLGPHNTDDQCSFPASIRRGQEETSRVHGIFRYREAGHCNVRRARRYSDAKNLMLMEGRRQKERKIMMIYDPAVRILKRLVWSALDR